MIRGRFFSFVHPHYNGKTTSFQQVQLANLMKCQAKVGVVWKSNAQATASLGRRCAVVAKILMIQNTENKNMIIT